MEKIKSLKGIIKKAQEKGPVNTAIIAPYDSSTMSAIKEGIEVGLIRPEAFGDAVKIKKAVANAQINPEDVKICDCTDTAIQTAIDSIRDDKNSLLMKGSITTPQLMKSCLNKTTGLNVGKSCCHVSVCEIPSFDRLIAISDGGLNVLPNVEQKVDIIHNIINLMHVLGVVEPRIALLASLEEVQTNIPATTDAAIITQMARRGQIKGGIIDGPLALDNIISEASAKKKGIQSEVAGKADAIIVPNIEAGNVLGKTLGYFAGSINAGLVLGAAAPIILPSRAGKPEAKWASLALGVLLA